MRVALSGALSDEGTIIVLQGVDEDGAWVTFGADRRPAQVALEALASGEDVEVDVDWWQVVGYFPEGDGGR